MADTSIVHRYFEAWNAHSAPSVFDTMMPGGTYTDPTVPSGVSDAAFLSLTQGFMAAFSELNFEVRSMIFGADGLVTVQYVMRGRHTGQLGPLAPTGRPVELPGVDVFRVAAGKIQTIEGYYDTGTLSRQLGA